MEQTPSDPATVEELSQLLRAFKLQRYAAKEAVKARGTVARRPPSVDERAVIFSKTGGRCPICGGQIDLTSDWAADHFKAHAAGGSADIDNFLPAHRSCNSYRWDRPPEEFRYVRELGFWLQREIDASTTVGTLVAAGFAAHEAARKRRRKTPETMNDECPELRLGVWVRTQIEKLTTVGRAAAAAYLVQLRQQ